MSNTAAMTLGDIEITVLTDGASVFRTGMFSRHKCRPHPGGGRESRRDGYPHQLQRQTSFAAVDGPFSSMSGAGSLMGPKCGHMPEALAEAGASTSDIDIFYATHLHPDSCRWCAGCRGQARLSQCTAAGAKGGSRFLARGNSTGIRNGARLAETGAGRAFRLCRPVWN